LKLLVDAGVDVNARTTGGYTALHYACKKRSIIGFSNTWRSDKTEEILVKLLLHHGADPNARSDRGDTPLHEISPERPELVDILVQNGADVNAKNSGGKTPLLRILTTMTSGWRMDGSNPKLAEQTLFKLLKHGADVKVEDNNKWTALHHMFAGMENFRNEELWQAFIKAGADLNQRNNSGKPPLLLMKECASDNPRASSC
jgi:ankyrin repeat protein